MRVTGVERVSRRSGRRMLKTSAAVLAAVGLLSAVPPAVQASSVSTATWTKQVPAASPPARSSAAMAYDAATGTAVLFGGEGRGGPGLLSDSWTWNGATWTQQAPAVHPPALREAAMAYDAATGSVVLFGGVSFHDQVLDQTWTWDGATWTKQAPAVHPPALVNPAMAYDAATGTVVLFGGLDRGHAAAGTWTWDGTTWAKQAPAAHPSARYEAAMAYDAATGTVVLFGGQGPGGHSGFALGDTWTWDGTAWARQAQAVHPPARFGAVMAYDAATGTVVLTGGVIVHPYIDTWTWDGTTWTKQGPAVHPPARPRRPGDGL
jgi:hypothetical protein